jgi:hypothetical protein
MSNSTKYEFLKQLQEIENLRKEAENYYNQYRDSLINVNKTLEKLASVASGVSFSVEGDLENFDSKFKEKTKKINNRSISKKQKLDNVEINHFVKKITPKKNLTKSKNQQKNKSLRETCLEVLSRDNSIFSEIFENYPENSRGLKVSELKHIIETEGLWNSISSNVSAQIQNTLHKLKNKEGLIDKNEEDRRYFIVEKEEEVNE